MRIKRDFDLITLFYGKNMKQVNYSRVCSTLGSEEYRAVPGIDFKVERNRAKK